MIDRPPHLDPLRPRLVQHAVEHIRLDTKSDMQVERVLPLEVERFPGTSKNARQEPSSISKKLCSPRPSSIGKALTKRRPRKSS